MVVLVLVNIDFKVYSPVIFDVCCQLCLRKLMNFAQLLPPTHKLIITHLPDYLHRASMLVWVAIPRPVSVAGPLATIRSGSSPPANFTQSKIDFSPSLRVFATTRLITWQRMPICSPTRCSPESRDCPWNGDRDPEIPPLSSSWIPCCSFPAWMSDWLAGGGYGC